MKRTKWVSFIITIISGGWKKPGMEYLNYLGFPMEKIEASGIISPVVKVSCEYRKSCYLNERIIIRVGIKEYKGGKLILDYSMTQ